MAVDRVEKRLKRVTAALDEAAIPYAVIGGNAVAGWVGRVDPSATRATKDVDVLVRRTDVHRVTQALQSLGFERQDLRGLTLFVDPDEPSRRAGVHVVWADEKVRPAYPHPAPSVTQVERHPEGFWLLELPALVKMKLTSDRHIDRAHIVDLCSVGLIDEQVRSTLPPDLRARLARIEETLDESEPDGA